MSYQDSSTAKGSLIPSAAGQRQISKLKSIASENWMHPAKVVLAGIVISVFIGLILYYTTTTLLQVNNSSGGITGSGLFDTSNWLTTGGGLLFTLFIILLLGFGGASFGMSWKNNGQSAMWSMLSSALIGIMYYFVFASAKDGRKDQFVLWSVLATIVSIGFPLYGWWTMKKMNDAVKNGLDADCDAADKEAIPKRHTWSLGMLIGSVILSIVIASGLWKIHSTLK
jgi:hypothetical protein